MSVVIVCALGIILVRFVIIVIVHDLIFIVFFSIFEKKEKKNDKKQKEYFAQNSVTRFRFRRNKAFPCGDAAHLGRHILSHCHTTIA